MDSLRRNPLEQTHPVQEILKFLCLKEVNRMSGVSKLWKDLTENLTFHPYKKGLLVSSDGIYEDEFVDKMIGNLTDLPSKVTTFICSRAGHIRFGNMIAFNTDLFALPHLPKVSELRFECDFRPQLNDQDFQHFDRVVPLKNIKSLEFHYSFHDINYLLKRFPNIDSLNLEYVYDPVDVSHIRNLKHLRLCGDLECFPEVQAVDVVTIIHEVQEAWVESHVLDVNKILKAKPKKLRLEFYYEIDPDFEMLSDISLFPIEEKLKEICTVVKDIEFVEEVDIVNREQIRFYPELPSSMVFDEENSGEKSKCYINQFLKNVK